MSWRRCTIVGAVALAAATLSGCAASPDDGSSAAAAQASEPLQVVGPFELHTIDPSTAGGFFTRLQVAETLVDADTLGTLQPGLASSWEVSTDQLSWSFTLRPDAVFHDGTEVTAEAVAASLGVAQGKVDTPLASSPVTAIDVVDDVVRISLSEPYAPLPAVLAHTSAQILAPASYGPDGEVTQIVGSGPYEVQRLQQPDRIEVVASDHWQGPRPAVEEVHYQSVSRAETRALMAESGQSDVTFGMDPVSLQRVTDAEGIGITAVTLPRTIQLKVNGDHEILGDARVRRALSLALDRDAMTTALLRDPEMAASQLFPPSLDAWHQSELEPLVHDPDAARDLLTEAGWSAGDDGILRRDGRRFEVTLRTFTDRPELPTLATAIQAAFAEVGVALEVRIGNSSEIPAGHQDGTLELALYARNFALVPDPLVTLLGDFGPDGADWGAMGWSDPTLTALLTDMAADTEAVDSSASRLQVAQILQDELPVIPVAWYRQSAVVSDRLDGLELDPLERSWLLSDVSWAN